MANEFDTNEGLTRREALKRGAMLGGALVWAVPVVQTVGISAAFAKEPSLDCCLKVEFTSDPVLVGNLVTFSWKLTNCGSHSISNATGFIDQSNNGGASWVNVVTDNKLDRAPGESIETAEDVDPPNGFSYLYRLHGQFDCLRSTGLWHTDPGGGVGTYIQKGPVIVP